MPLTTDAVADIAEALVRARRDGLTLPLPDDGPTSSEEAYAIQDAVVLRLGQPVGWKVGAPSRDAEPSCAPLLPGTLAGPAERHERRVRVPVAAEVEFAFVMGKAFRAGSEPPDEAAVLDAVASCHLAIELCACRWLPGRDSPLLWRLADNAMNEGLLLGPKLSGWRADDYGALQGELSIDGGVADTARRPTSDDIRGLLTWLVRHCVEHRGGLAEGAVVTTGSWTGMHFLSVPTDIAGRIGPHPPLQARLIP